MEGVWWKTPSGSWPSDSDVSLELWNRDQTRVNPIILLYQLVIILVAHFYDMYENSLMLAICNVLNTDDFCKYDSKCQFYYSARHH